MGSGRDRVGLNLRELVEERRHIWPAIVAFGLVFDVVLDWQRVVSY